jgi:predicted DNA-binding transcriptional regulator YafY
MIQPDVDRTERFYKIDRLLREQRVVSFAALLAHLEVSRATLKRDLEYMRSRLYAPIRFDREAGGYRLAADRTTESRYALPGLWFSAAEIHALLTLQHLLANLQAGSVLGPHLKAVSARLEPALGGADRSAGELRRRVRILDIAARRMQPEHFELVGSALVRRRRLRMTYFGRGRGDVTERDVSPQRLVHYRDNWYLDAYCHLRDGLRSFAVDAIRSATMLERAADDVAEATLDAVLGSGYGIFSGEHVTWAKLRFTPERARWVAAERWHPLQRTRFDADGSFVLELPYSDPRELVMDVLRHGADVEVLAPDALRREVIETLEAARRRYARDADGSRSSARATARARRASARAKRAL